jgi:hypothetical protein
VGGKPTRLAPGPGHRWCDEDYCIFELDALERLLERIRAAFGDFATLAYPSHLDD